jgi:hypothetical protein
MQANEYGQMWVDEEDTFTALLISVLMLFIQVIFKHYIL